MKSINHIKSNILSILFFFLLSSFNLFSQNSIKIEPKPATIFIEQGSHKQIINFDFLVTHTAKDTLYLYKLSVSVFDTNNNLLQTRFLDNNGTAPSIKTLSKRIWNGEETHLIFNPFSEFEITAPIKSLQYE